MEVCGLRSFQRRRSAARANLLDTGCSPDRLPGTILVAHRSQLLSPGKQGTPVRFRDGPAAVSRRLFRTGKKGRLISSHCEQGGPCGLVREKAPAGRARESEDLPAFESMPTCAGGVAGTVASEWSVAAGHQFFGKRSCKQSVPRGRAVLLHARTAGVADALALRSLCMDTARSQVPLRVSRAGMTLVELLVVVAIVAALVAILLPAVQAAREAARRANCASNLRHVGCALHGYLLSRGRFPVGCLEWKAGTGGTSRCLAWSAFILPWLEEQTTASRVNYQKPFDDPANAVAAATVIQTYLCPSAGRTSTLVGGMAACDYGGVVGERICSPNNPEKGVLCTGNSYGVKDIVDGLSKTILVAECSREPWADGQWINGRNLFDQFYAINASMPFWEDEMRSRHPSGAQALAGDGSVQFIDESVDRRILAAALTRSRGESPAAPWVAP